MPLKHRLNPLLAGFLSLSLLLHLAVLYLLPDVDLLPSPPRAAPVYVEMRPPVPRERELAPPPVVPAKEIPRETPARRLAAIDQVARQETAPRGTAPEERTPAVAQPTEAAPPPETAPPLPAEMPQAAAPGDRAQPLPDLRVLTQLTPRTVARLEDQWRHKYRQDVAAGNAVWLDTEKDILISFFQRFRNQIYGVWNYPARSAERGEQGACLLKIAINRDGSLRGVELLESSGFARLDEEALAAIRKGAPFGNLPRAYPEETLNIFAFFKYELGARFIY